MTTDDTLAVLMAAMARHMLSGGRPAASPLPAKPVPTGAGRPPEGV